MGGPYNLLDEHWIPVLYHDGRWERVGIEIVLRVTPGRYHTAISNVSARG